MNAHGCRWLASIAVLAVFALVPTVARADELEKCRELERRAFDLELAGSFPEAQNAFCEALVAYVKEAVRVARSPAPGGVEDVWDSPRAEAEFLFAWAEVLASNAHQLTYWTSRPGELAERFESARGIVASVQVGQRHAPPARELASILTYRLMEIYLRTGGLRGARRESERLGFVTDWRIIGPFENEQGGGFDVAYPPESLWGLRTDYDAAYVGKKHPLPANGVSWREVPVTPVDGVIDIDECLRPNEEAIAYATTFVRSATARDVTLRIATDDGFQLWLNGRKLHSRRVERARTFDQDLIDARLEEGWNQILVKIADDHVDWEFAFRITDREGAPLTGLRGELEVDSSVVREIPRAEGGLVESRPRGAIPYFRRRLDRIFRCADPSRASGSFSTSNDRLHVEVDLEGKGLAALMSQTLGKPFKGRFFTDRSVMESIFKERAAAEWVKALPNHARAVVTSEVTRLWYALGRLHASLGAHGVKHHPDREAIRKAVDLEPKTTRYLHALSRVSTDWVVMEAERNENPRVRVLGDLVAALRHAQDGDTELVEGVAAASSGGRPSRAGAAHYELASYYLHRQANASAALRHAEAAIEITGEFPLARLVKVDAYRLRGWDELARAELETLAEEHPDDPIVQSRWGAFLLERRLGREALRAYTIAYRADNSSPDLRRALAQCHLSLGKLYAAIDLEKSALSSDPFDVGARLEMARLYESKDDFAAAAEAAKGALEIAPEDHLALSALGRAMQAMGRTRDARAAWNRALSVMPNYVELERYLAFLEGKITYDRRFAEDTAGLIERARSYVPKEDDPLVEVLDKVMDRVYLDGTRSRTVHRICLVRNNRGIAEFGRPYVFFYPAEQVVKVRTVRVFRADGSVEEAPTGDEGRVVKTGYGGRSARVIGVPPLRAGDMVEVEYRVDDTSQGFFGKYFGGRVRLRSGHPRLRSKYVLIAPKDRELFFHTRGAVGSTTLSPPRGGEIGPAVVSPEIHDWPEEGSTVYTWTLEPAPKIRREPLMPPTDELGLQIQVSTYKDWGEFGRWYWNLVRDQHRTNAEIEGKTRELVAGRKTAPEKIRAIYDFVSSDIQYNAWEFGVHGFKPYRATKIFHQKFGDCKDKATLMKAMLGLVGIESYPALVRATLRRPEEDLTLPLFDHFNHMILYVPRGGDNVVVPTAPRGGDNVVVPTAPRGGDNVVVPRSPDEATSFTAPRLPAQQPAEPTRLVRRVGGRGELWLDGTTTLHDMEVVPISDAGALACVIYPDGGRIKRIPEEPPGGNSLLDEVRLDISRKGDRLSAKMQVTSRARGWCANFARFRFNGLENARRMLERLYSKQLPSLKLLSVKTSDLEDIGVPVEYTFKAGVSEFGAARGPGDLGPDTGAEARWFFRPLRSPFRGAFRGEWALLTPDKLSGYATLADREHDLVLSAPWSYENRVRYTLSEGLEFAHVPEGVEIEGPFGRFRLSYELASEPGRRTLRAAKEIVIKTSRVRRADYAAFRVFCNKVDRAERREIGVRCGR